MVSASNSCYILLPLVAPVMNSLSTAPSGSPQGLTGASHSPYSVSLSWTAPLVEEQNGHIIQYIINITHSDSLVTQQFTTNVTNFTVPNLEPFTTYICIVAAETSGGQGPFSNIFIVQTQESGIYTLPIVQT